MKSQLRVGNFTSSEIYRLMSVDRSGKKPGVPYHSYIEECNIERRLNRPITKEETNAAALNWGHLVEKRVFDLLGTEYSLNSDETLPHPEIDCWAGSPDNLKYVDGKAETVCDIKAPHTLKSFCQLIDAWQKGGIEEIRNTHKDGEKYYWQLVSNAIITGCSQAELIVYAPYKSELDAIRQLAEGVPRYYRIWGSPDEELPWIIEGEHYKNLNVIRFEVPFLDKQDLTDRVIMASNELVARKLLITA